MPRPASHVLAYLTIMCVKGNKAVTLIEHSWVDASNLNRVRAEAGIAALMASRPGLLDSFLVSSTVDKTMERRALVSVHIPSIRPSLYQALPALQTLPFSLYKQWPREKQDLEQIEADIPAPTQETAAQKRARLKSKRGKGNRFKAWQDDKSWAWKVMRCSAVGSVRVVSAVASFRSFN